MLKSFRGTTLPFSDSNPPTDMRNKSQATQTITIIWRRDQVGILVVHSGIGVGRHLRGEGGVLPFAGTCRTASPHGTVDLESSDGEDYGRECPSNDESRSTRQQDVEPGSTIRLFVVLRRTCASNSNYSHQSRTSTKKNSATEKDSPCSADFKITT